MQRFRLFQGQIEHHSSPHAVTHEDPGDPWESGDPVDQERQHGPAPIAPAPHGAAPPWRVAMTRQVQGFHCITVGHQGLGEALKAAAVAADAMDAEQPRPRPAHGTPMPVGQGASNRAQQRCQLWLRLGIGFTGVHYPMMK